MHPIQQRNFVSGSTPETVYFTLLSVSKEKKEMKVMAITNEKGGVGKTTTAVSLAYELKQLGKSVLLIDNDPQSNLTTHCGTRNPQKEGFYSLTKLYEIILENLSGNNWTDDGWDQEPLPPIEKVVIQKNGFNYISADLNLESAERQMYITSGTDRIMEDVINKYADSYDYVLIDCRPSLGKLTVNAMAVSDSIIIVMPCEHYAIEGMNSLLRSIKTVKKRLNHKIQIEGILLTQYQGRHILTQDLSKIIRDQIGKQINIFKNVIPTSVKVKEAVALNKAIGEYKPDNPAAIGYKELAIEIIKEKRSKR